jgi:DNA-binding transcriptional regulator LsrR (DeoR family)
MTDLNKREMAQIVSILYYEKNKSQNEIAEELNISRSYVSQLLSYAKEIGIVKIIINIDEYNLRMIRRELDFKSKFPGLKHVYIMSSDSEDFTNMNLGKFAVPYITDMINDSEVIGINLGLSVEKTIDSLNKQDFQNTNNKKVVQIMGGFYKNSIINSAHPNEIVNKLSSILGCECYFLNCPAIVEEPDNKFFFMKENSIKKVIDLWDHLDLAIMGIGVADQRSKLFNLFNSEMIKKITESHVCSEVTINFFRENGAYEPILEQNKISISYEQLKKVKKKVAICSGEYKKHAVLAALRAGMIDVLISDSLTIDAIEKII